MANAPDNAGTDATTPPRGFQAVVPSTPAAPDTAISGGPVESAEQAVSVAISQRRAQCNDAGLC